ncbi:MAG: OsmC family protein [Gemmatimonadota bacterium]
MHRRASAHWEGGIEGGGGTLSTTSGVLDDTPYGFSDRFEEGPNTNPEELIGAAHAGCYAMALSGVLEEAGMTPESLDVTADVTLEKKGEGFEVTAVYLDLRARIPGADEATFLEAADGAKEGCPVSKLLNAETTLDAHLEG